jgi:hypothetical protein
MVKVKGISYKVHPDFFNQILEPKRKYYEKKLNVSISQNKLTELLAREMKFNPTKIRPIKIPKRRFRL